MMSGIGNPNYWWGMYPPSSLFLPNHVLGSSSSIPFNDVAENQEHPHSFNLLLLGGFSAGDEERRSYLSHFQPHKLENWENQFLNPLTSLPVNDILKYEVFQTSNYYSHELPTLASSFSQTKPASSPSSCVTSGIDNGNILYFSHNNLHDEKNPLNQRSSQYSKKANAGTGKKARVQSSSSQPPLKVRKEKLGDRIIALYQLVSPFGKTDTASVLFEATGYIRFLYGQIEALSSPYLSTSRKQHSVQPEGLSVFPEDPGQLLNDTCLKRKLDSQQGNQEKQRDLRSRGLCLASVSCCQYFGSDNSAVFLDEGYGGGVDDELKRRSIMCSHSS